MLGYIIKIYNCGLRSKLIYNLKVWHKFKLLVASFDIFQEKLSKYILTMVYLETCTSMSGTHLIYSCYEKEGHPELRIRFV